MMVPLFVFVLSTDVHILFLSLWLDMRSLATLDTAVTNNALRPYWMTVLHSLRGGVIDDWGHSMSSLTWLIRRGIHAKRVEIKEDAWRVRGSDLLLLEKDAIAHLGLNRCFNLTDQCVMDMVKECSKLTSIDLNGCKKLTDVGVSALGAVCGKLQSIILDDCDKVTDAGVSALAAGCGQLHSISLFNCDKVTDAGVSELGAGCGQLQRINLARCDKVTDAGVSALGAGCDQLQSIDHKYCN